MHDDESIDLSTSCQHVSAIQMKSVQRPALGCQECLETGGWWVHLRICLTCGHVGCCDSSPRRHARAHYHATHHPIITSGEAHETWVYCFADAAILSGQ